MSQPLTSTSPVVADRLTTLATAEAYAKETHGMILADASGSKVRSIIQADGLTSVVALLDTLTTETSKEKVTYLEAIRRGARAADEFLWPPEDAFNVRSWKHGHNPDTHLGWTMYDTCFTLPGYIFASAAGEARRHFDQAYKRWNSFDPYGKRKDYSALKALGEALHFVQDQLVPQHAKASPESASASKKILDPTCRGNGSHDFYEDFVKNNWTNPAYHATNCGTYWFHWWPNPSNPYDPHSVPSTAYGWVDRAAHLGIQYYDRVSNPADQSQYGPVTAALLPEAERKSAGFIVFFFEAVGLVKIQPDIGRCASAPYLFTDAYARAGGSATVGTARSVARSWVEGQIQYFRGGFGNPGDEAAIIYQNTAPFAYAVYGTIWRKYVAVDGRFRLGWPIADEQSAVSRYGTQDRYQKFCCHDWPIAYTGSIELHRSGTYLGQAFMVRGAIYKKWSEMGYASSCLGLPASDEYAWGDGVRQNFEAGYHMYSNSGGTYPDCQ